MLIFPEEALIPMEGLPFMPILFRTSQIKKKRIFSKNTMEQGVRAMLCLGQIIPTQITVLKA